MKVGDGKALRDMVLDLFEEKRPDWLVLARDAAWSIWRETGRPVTVNQVRERVPPPPDIDPRVFGAVFRRSEWKAGDFVLSDRRTCHARPIREFTPRHP
jgi:hypothetical protein